MANEATFVYAADLRLGAPMRGFRDLSPEWQARLRRAVAGSFERVVDVAIARAVDHVVFAGEIFDRARPSYGECVRFFEGLDRLDEAGIGIYLAAGSQGLRASFERDARRLPASAVVLADDDADLAPEGLDLCGALSRGVQAVDSRETGELGCHVAAVSAGELSSAEFVPTSSVVFERPEIDVSACQTLADITHLVQAELFRMNGSVVCDDMVAHVALVGETDLHGYLSQADVRASLRKRVNAAYPSFFCDALEDRTTRARAEGPLPKLVEEMAVEQRHREDVLINYVQSEFVKRGVAVPSALSSDVLEFNAAAERLVLDLLRGGEEAPE